MNILQHLKNKYASDVIPSGSLNIIAENIKKNFNKDQILDIDISSKNGTYDVKVVLKSKPHKINISVVCQK